MRRFSGAELIEVCERVVLIFLRAYGIYDISTGNLASTDPSRSQAFFETLKSTLLLLPVPGMVPTTLTNTVWLFISFHTCMMVPIGADLCKARYFLVSLLPSITSAKPVSTIFLFSYVFFASLSTW